MMQNDSMATSTPARIKKRTTVTLDADAYEVATIYAEANDISLGEALGELVRKATAPTEKKTQQPALKRSRNGLLLLPSRGKVITPELVKQILEEEFD